MLADAEQRRLTAIESQLHTDDPAFVRQFRSGWENRPQASWLLVGLAALTVLALVLFITHGFAGVLVAGFIGLLLGNYLAHRHTYTNLVGRYPRHGDRMD